MTARLAIVLELDVDADEEDAIELALLNLNLNRYDRLVSAEFVGSGESEEAQK